MPSAAPALVDVLRALAEALGRLGASWYVFGAQAVIVWGRPRFTEDIDVTVRMVPEAPQRLVRETETFGFKVRFGVSDDFVAKTRILPLVHMATGWPVDVVLAGPGLEERFIARAVPVPLGDTLRVPFISPEDLIVTKILAGRSKDLDDVRGVLAERVDTLDLEIIRETLHLLEQALSVGDLLPVFEAEIRSVRKERLD